MLQNIKNRPMGGFYASYGLKSLANRNEQI